MSFLDVFKHLLPSGKAWNITIDKNLKQFFEGLSIGVGDSVKLFFDEVFEDAFPQTTRELESWETQFGLPASGLTEQQRRDRLEAAWKAKGGQDPTYIQETLQAAGFDVYVHEWWVPGSEPAVGSLGTAIARDPFLYLNDNITPLRFASLDGGADMQDGDLAVAMDGQTLQPSGYPLVNKIYTYDPDYISDGAVDMYDAGQYAMDGAVTGLSQVYNLKQYVMTADPDFYPYYLYIGGQTFPDHATVPGARQNEFETLCLKICPAQQWLGILVDYS